MKTDNSLPVHWRAIFIMLSLPALRVSAGEPAQAWLEDFQRGDASRIPAYTLRVTLEEPANFMLRDQGNTVWTCTITQGPNGFAASCQAHKLPKPVYHAPGTFSYRGMDYDGEGNLVIWMKTKWVTLRNKVANETYAEQQSFFVNPQGVVVRSGVNRRLDRCPPEDQGRCSWSFTTLRRIWWALGHGLASDLIKVEGDISDSGKMNRARIRGTVFGFPGGVWQMAVEKPPTKLVREATFIRDVDGQLLYKVTTHGARQFGDVTLAEGGSFFSLFGDGFEALERRVVLQDFQARFDDQLFAEVKRTLESLEGQNVAVVDYRSDPKNPLRTFLGVTAPRDRDDK